MSTISCKDLLMLAAVGRVDSDVYGDGRVLVFENEWRSGGRFNWRGANRYRRTVDWRIHWINGEFHETGEFKRLPDGVDGSRTIRVQAGGGMVELKRIVSSAEAERSRFYFMTARQAGNYEWVDGVRTLFERTSVFD